MKKWWKKIPSDAYPIIGLVALAVVLGFLISVHFNAQSTGRGLGEGAGMLVGRAIGSIEGLTVGQIEGYNAGKAAGLSAEDTTVELSGKIKEVNRLQVLVASGTVSDILTVGNLEASFYAGLISMEYNAVFTVDLATAGIDLRSDGLHILLDQPRVDFNPDGEPVIVDEYQTHSFTGSVDAGHEAYINSTSQMRSRAVEKLESDTSMMASARISAIIQLKQLVKAVSLSKPVVFVEFRD